MPRNRKVKVKADLRPKQSMAFLPLYPFDQERENAAIVGRYSHTQEGQDANAEYDRNRSKLQESGGDAAVLKSMLRCLPTFDALRPDWSLVRSFLIAHCGQSIENLASLGLSDVRVLLDAYLMEKDSASAQYAGWRPFSEVVSPVDISRSTLSKKCKSKEIKSARVGGRLLIDPKSLAEYLRRKKVQDEAKENRVVRKLASDGS